MAPVYVRRSIHIQRPFAACAQALAGAHGTWFPQIVARVGDEDGRRLAAVGPTVAGARVTKRVIVRVEEPGDDPSVVEFSWQPTFPRQLFPDFEGKIVIAPVDPDVSRLTVSGTYVPPLGALGQVLDEALMHRAAEATVQELAAAIAAQLERMISQEPIPS